MISFKKPNFRNRVNGHGSIDRNVLSKAFGVTAESPVPAQHAGNRLVRNVRSRKDVIMCTKHLKSRGETISEVVYWYYFRTL